MIPNVSQNKLVTDSNDNHLFLDELDDSKTLMNRFTVKGSQFKVNFK